MKTFRNSLIVCAIAALTVPALAQHTKTEPSAKSPHAKGHANVSHSSGAMAAEIGKPAPDFALKDVNDKEVKLADFKGKIVVLEWSNAGCPFCVRHAKNKTAENTLATFKGKDVIWVNIDSTASASPDKVKEFMKDNGMTAPWLMDPTGATGKAYGAKTTPHMFVIDAKGMLAYSGAIDDDARGDKEDARNYVKEAIEALLKGSTVATATTDSYGCSVKYAN